MVNEKVFNNALNSMLDLPIDGTNDEAIVVMANLDTGDGKCHHVLTVKGNALSTLHLLAYTAELVVHGSTNPMMQKVIRDKLRCLLSEHGI